METRTKASLKPRSLVGPDPPLQHKHLVTEGQHHTTEDIDQMLLGKETFEAHLGDTICINSGTAHSIENIVSASRSSCFTEVGFANLNLLHLGSTAEDDHMLSFRWLPEAPTFSLIDSSDRYAQTGSFCCR